MLPLTFIFQIFEVQGCENKHGVQMEQKIQYHILVL